MTTELPYTDADLRAAAMDQHAAALRDPDFVGIGEQLEGRYVRYEVVNQGHGGVMPPPGTPRWDELSEDDFDAAQRAIDDLLGKAAPISEWAINLGADGLEPTGHRIEIAGPDGGVAVRLHFAFDADMPTATRGSVVADVVTALSPVVPLLRQS